MSSLVSYESFVDECLAMLKQRFSEMADSNNKTNVGYWLQCFAFDVIGKITVSTPFLRRVPEKAELIRASSPIASDSWTKVLI